MITGMNSIVKFDRPINDKHYIVPGGYEIETSDGKTLGFDFERFDAFIDDEDPCVLHFEQQKLDILTFPQAAHLEEALLKLKRFSEFFVYTGEPNEDEEIRPVKVLDISFDRYYKPDLKIAPCTTGAIAF